MTKKASSAAEMAADFFKKPALLSEGGVAFSTGLLLFLLGFFAPVRLSAQGCQTEADFTFVVNGCDVEFTPTYSGPGTVMQRSWVFHEGILVNSPPVSGITNHPNPIHTFDGGNGARTVVHTVSVMLPGGQFINAACTKEIQVSCPNECNFFTYTVSGCVVSFRLNNAVAGGADWDFGDGTTATGNLVSHTYPTDGEYEVVMRLPFITCTKTIRVACASDPEPDCCTAEFTGNITRDCGILCLNLNAYCTALTGHTWTVSGSPCLTVDNLNNSPNQPCIQLTNINTKNTTFVTVNHTRTCTNGTSHTLTKTIHIPANIGEAVFIGIRRPQPTKLSDFMCVIPDLKYPISAAAADAIPLYVSGIVEVNKGSTSVPFSFLGADVRMDPGMTGFDVLGKYWLSIGMSKTGVPTTMRSAPDCNCLWRGNRVLSKGRLTTGTIFNQQAGYVLIEDAVFGIRAQPGSVLEIQGTSFKRNFVGIRATEGNFSLLQFRGNEFDGQGPLKDICTLQGLTLDMFFPTVPGGEGNPTLPETSLNIPIGFYVPDYGHSGMYLANLSNFQINALPPEAQNLFQNLCYGIIAYDCNVNIAPSCRFVNILPYYGVRRSAGVALIDRANGGANTLRFVGNGQNVLPATFENCMFGIHVRSQQNIAPTQAGILNTRMESVRCGIYLDAMFNGGSFRSNAMNGLFSGIHDNRINATLNNLIVPSQAGISFWDQHPTVSNVEIYNNNVRVSYFNAFQIPKTVSGGTTGIAGIGLLNQSEPGPPFIELDIHDNRVEVSGLAQIGIGLDRHPNGRIRNQRGGNATAGNGIFMNGTAMWAGIATTLGSNNLVACNEITTTVPPVELSLIQSYFQTNTDYFRNTMTGPGVGTQFRENCANARFQCNEMNNNTVGLSYTEGGETGDQGTAAVTFGNRWVGNFTTGAEVDATIDFTKSKYFTRNLNNEAPPSVAGPLGWFNNANPDATVGCILENCPAPPGMVPPVVVTRLDERVAADSLNYGTQTHAAEREWQHRYLLYRKLMDYPQLTQGNALLQGFVAAPGDNIAALWQAEMASRSALVPSAVVQSAMGAHQQGIQTAQAQLHLIDSLLVVTEDSAQFVALLSQRDVQDSIMNVLALASEILATQFTALRDATIPSILNQLAAISPANICEANLRRAHEIYLLTAAVGVLPDSTELADLRSIGEQCRAVGGLGVSIAQGLYQSFTGEAFIENCDSTANRSSTGQAKIQGALMQVYPNPNPGGFVVQLPEGYAEKDALLRITDAFGTEVQRLYTTGRTTLEVNLMGQPSGVYFVMLRDGDDTSIRPVLVQH